MPTIPRAQLPTPRSLPTPPFPHSAPKSQPLNALQFSRRASTTTVTDTNDSILKDNLTTFRSHLKTSTRILALLGAGLSAASGLPTFRGAGGLWRRYEATSLATPGAFRRDPGLVWQFYAYRRRTALLAQPNPAHFALAEVAKKKEGFVTLSQNVDAQLHLLHGNLFDLKCSSHQCDYIERNNTSDPLVPALTLPPPSSNSSFPQGEDHHIPPSELPHCPKCDSLLRPGVVWFGESLPRETIARLETWLAEAGHIDLMLVIGTAAVVHPAAGYIDRARRMGARIAVVNMEDDFGAARRLGENDWLFQGDAGILVPEMLKDVLI